MTTKPSTQTAVLHNHPYEQLPAILWQADVNSLQHLHVSQYAEKILGYTKETWLSQPNFWQSIIHPNDLEHVLLCYQTVQATSHDQQTSYRMRDTNGRYHWFRDQITHQGTMLAGIRTPTHTYNQAKLLSLIAQINQNARSETQLRQHVKTLLQHLCEWFQVDSIYIYQIKKNTPHQIKARHRYSWNKTWQLFQIDKPQLSTTYLPIDQFRTFIAPLQEGKTTIYHHQDLSATQKKVFAQFNIQTALFTPIIIEGVFWGFLGCHEENKTRHWFPHEKEIMQHISLALGFIIQNIALHKSEAQEKERAQMLREFSQLVNSPFDLNTILQRILTRLKSILTFDSASIYLFGGENENGSLAAIGFKQVDLVQKEASERLKTNAIIVDMINDPKPILIPDVRQHAGWIWISGAELIRSFMAVPLLNHKRKMIGALMVDSYEINYFHEEHLQTIEDLANHLSIAIHNAQLYEKEANRRQEAELFNEIMQKLSNSLDLDNILQQTLQAISQYVPDIHNCGITLLEQDNTFLRKRAEWVKKPDYKLIPIGHGEWLHNTPYLRHALQTGEPLVIKDVSQIEHHNNSMRYSVDLGIRSTLSIPLIVQEKPLGFLHVNLFGEQSYNFSQHEITLCQHVANYAALAIQNAYLFAEKQKQLGLAQTLQKVGAILTTQLSLDEVYTQIFDLLTEVIQYDTVSLHLIEEETNRLILGYDRHTMESDAVHQLIIQMSDHILAKVSHPPYCQVVSDTTNDETWLHMPELAEVKSWIGAGLVIQGKMIGILNVDSHTPNTYDKAEGEMVAAFANQAAIAIENARLHQVIHRQISELTVLHKIATAVSPQIDTLLTHTTQLLEKEFKPDAVGFVMIDQSKQTLMPHPSYIGIPDDQRTLFDLSKNPSVVTEVIQTNAPILVRDVRKTEQYYPARNQTLSEIAVPLHVNGEIVSILNLESDKVKAFNQNDLRFLTTLARQIAVVLERTALYDKLTQQTKSLSQRVAKQTAELRAEHERTLDILNSAGEGIVLTDENANIQYTNQAMAYQTGYSREALQTSQATLLHHAYSPNKGLQRALKNNERWTGELQLTRKDNTIVDVSLTLTPLFDPHGKHTGLVGVQSDISHLKEVERLKSQFVANVSHQLRTPLTTIKMYHSLLVRGRKEKVPRYLDILNVETDRLARLIENLLFLSKLETEPYPTGEDQVDLVKILQWLYQSYQFRAQALGLTLTAVIPDTLPPVPIKEQHIQPLIQNLLHNALDYTTEGGHIQIKAGTQEKKVWIQIIDDGVGIAEEELPFIFDRFFRGQITTDNNELPGTGLGLAIVQEIVTRYHGSITAESQPGQGATFTVWLPQTTTE